MRTQGCIGFLLLLGEWRPVDNVRNCQLIATCFFGFVWPQGPNTLRNETPSVYAFPSIIVGRVSPAIHRVARHRKEPRKGGPRIIKGRPFPSSLGVLKRQ